MKIPKRKSQNIESTSNLNRKGVRSDAIRDLLPKAPGIYHKKATVRFAHRRLPFPSQTYSISTSWLMIVLLLWHATFIPFANAANCKSLPDKPDDSAARRVDSKSSPASRKITYSRQTLSLQAEVSEAAVVRRAPTLNGGRIEGSVRQLTGENVTLNGGVTITTALLVPGTPQVRLNGHPIFGGTVEGTGSTHPSGYRVTLNGNITLGRLVTRTDAIPMPSVAPPPPAAGTRDVVLNRPGQSPGDFATIRDLTLNGNVGNIAVPPGTYRNFTANGNSGFIFGIAGSTEPAVYNLNRMILNGNSKLQVVGPVILTLSRDVVLNGSMGVATNPLWLMLNVASGGVTLNGGSSLYGIVRAPIGTVILNGNTLLQGAIFCDRFTLNGNSMLKGQAGALAQISPARATQGQTLNVSLRGINTHWVEGQTLASFGEEISVGGAEPGELGLIQVIDSTTAVAQVTVSPTAALAPRLVRVVSQVASPDDVQTETSVNGFLIVAATPPGSSSSRVLTIAGIAGSPGFADGPASQARFRDLAGVATGSDDDTYIADAGNNRIRVIRSDSNGNLIVTTLAGDGTAGFADGPATSALFNNPRGIAASEDGTVYIADTNNHRIRKIAPDGTVTTLAGDGTTGFQDGQGNQALFNSPGGIAIDSLGNLYIADTGNSAVRFITPQGVVSTVAGDGTIGSSDSPNARFNGLAGVAVDGLTVFIYLADTGNHRIRRLDPNGAVITVAGAERGFADGTASQARFADPTGIAVDGASRIIVADATNSLVREIDPELALSSAPMAVMTLAGTGERGITDGAGDQARFFTPRGVAVSRSSAIIVADTGNHVIRRILLPPVINALSPQSTQPGESVMITGARFDGRSPDRNTVRFTRSAQAGGGQTVATVTAADRNQLTVIVPADAATGPVSVETEGGTATSPVDFEVLSSGLAITDFNPKSAPAGTLINVSGENLAPPQGTAAQVTLNKQGGGTIEAPVASTSSTSLSFVIPTGAATGNVTVSIGGQSATSSAILTIITSSDFALTAVPASADLIQGQEIAYVVRLASNSGFNQLADLNVTGLPAGATASFKPQRITAGQTAVLTLKAPANQQTGATSLTISASATVDSIPLSESANVTVNVVPVTTTFRGRTVVADTLQTPLAGVTVTMLGRDGNGNPTGCSGQTVSDAAGNFAFTNLPQSCTGPQLIRYDGTTAVSPPGEYAGVDLVYNIVPNQVTASPVLVHLPRIDNKETVLVKQNAPTDQTFAFSTIPGLEATVYAGTTLKLVDGTQPDPFPFTAVQVPIDRLPDAKPPNPNMLMVFIVAFQPANAEASQPVAITYPNTINTPPGVNMVLMTLDPRRGEMVPYGTGTVSNDGRQVIPDLDPANPGKRFGLVHFDWHGQMPPTRNDVNPGPECVRTGKPIDLASGLEVINETDISVNSLIGSVEITRTYRTLSNPANPNGPFGFGSNHNYGFRLDTAFPENAQVINLIMPDGNQFPFSKGADGTFINSTIPSMSGARMRVVSSGTVDLRWKDGTVFRFVRKGTFLAREVLESITDPNGSKITLVLNDDGQRITEIIDSLGRITRLFYNNANNIVEIQDPIGRSVKYSYTSAIGLGNVLRTVTNPEGGVTRYDYNLQDHVTAITDARGVVIASNTYDQNGRVIEQRQADGSILKFSYQLLNPLVRTSPVIRTVVTDPLGRETVYRFNPQGFVTDLTDSTGQTRIIERDGSNQIIAVRGAASCQVCGVSGAGDQFFSYDSFGNLLTSTDALGNITRFTYDPVFNRVTSITDALGNVTRFTYDSNGNILTSTDARGNKTTFGYGGVGQVVVFGLIRSITDPLNKTTSLSYDGFGNLSKITDALGNTTTISYDAVSRPIATMDSLGRRTSIAYDKLDRVLSVTDAKGGVTRFSYDAVGNLLSVMDAKGNTTSFTYDAMNRLLTRTTPLNKTDRREYDLNGNLIKFTDRRGQTSLFEYDELNRLTLETYQDGSVVTRSYDSNSRLIQVDDANSQQPVDAIPGSFRFAYDSAGRLTSSASRFGTVEYIYDALGRVTSRQVIGQAAVDYEYDSVGNLTRAATTGASVDFAYDVRNQLANINRANGVSSQYIYDDLGRLLSLVHSRGTTIINSQSYTYDAIGNRTGNTTNIGQPLVTQPATAQYDAGNRLLQRGAISYSYDDNGNLASETGPGGAVNYAWDSRNRLLSISSSSGQTINFLYDFAGNLMQQKDTGSELNLTQTFVLDDLTNVAYLSNSNGEQFSVLTGQFIDEHLAMLTQSGKVEYGLTDAINSTVASVDDSGSIRGLFSYEPFGETSGTRSGYIFRYAGRVPVLQSTYYNRARFYNTTISRFLSEDPIGIGTGLNLYSYVDNNPVNLIDPSGLLSLSTIFRTIRLSIVSAILFASPIPGSKAQAVLKFFQKAGRGVELVIKRKKKIDAAKKLGGIICKIGGKGEKGAVAIQFLSLEASTFVGAIILVPLLAQPANEIDEEQIVNGPSRR